MAFKMNGPAMYPNFRGKNLKSSMDKQSGPNIDLAINREYPKGPDMRATSAPFQMNHDQAKKAKKKPSQGDFIPAYEGADISEAEYKKMKGLGITSEQMYAEYKAAKDKKAWLAKNVKKKPNTTTAKK